MTARRILPSESMVSVIIVAGTCSWWSDFEAVYARSLGEKG